ncbi:MAG: UDP-N-acetylmuramoyl-L-alanyl-D-glutamate--2,6-diaminopimelate ligase [Saprospiraceae bacterium]|nr:UDP-N-acetylmuramoyl-L-alanyl-D-glutamate--2,6-diaminopimelate ligase [Saprospiraceae bacterium]
MKGLQDILYGVSLEEVIGVTTKKVSAVCIDSRNSIASSVFVALKGSVVDGHEFIAKAIDLGATVIVCEVLPENRDKAITYLRVKNSRKAAGIIAANFYDHPSKQLKLIGVTGTNGKTTIATLLHQLFSAMGVHVGLLSTIENKIGSTVLKATHTTPDVISLNALLQDMVDDGCEYAFMEVSSHAVDQDRIAGVAFAGGVFTNLTRDHLDYHKTFKAYLEAKKAFFDGLPKSAFALVNTDDKNGLVMVQNTKAKTYSYGLRSLANYKVKILENSFDGLLLNLDGIDLYTKLIGDFNALNLAAVYATAVLLGEDQTKILTALSQLSGAAGRFERSVSPSANIIGIVDYAHTPDALEKVLKTIASVRTGNEQLITIVGCGGDRDKGKRPLMAAVAADLSNKVILTSDNPRTEDPNAILADMKAGVKISQQAKVLSISDRREAIRTACTLAQPKDIILIAGKGHENYQEIKGQRLPFDDKEELANAFKELKK